MWPFSSDDEEGKPTQPAQQSMDPTVENYLKQKMELEKKVQEAKDNDSYNRKVEGVGRILGGLFSGGKNNDAFYDSQRADSEKQITRAQENANGLPTEFNQLRQLKDFQAKDKETAEERDPNSQRSMVARQTAKKFANGLIPDATLATMSAADIMKNMPFLEKAYQVDSEAAARKATLEQNTANRAQAQANSDREFALKEKEFGIKQNGNKAAFDNLPEENKKAITALAEKNAGKTSIANQMNSYLDQYRQATSADEKVRIGRQMLKVLNSTEGADAVGEGERKNLGAALETQLFNLTNPGPMFGKDLPGFDDQVVDTINSVRNAITQNNSTIEGLKSGQPLQVPGEVAKLPRKKSGTAVAGGLTDQDKMAIEWAKNNRGDPRSKQILEMHGEK